MNKKKFKTVDAYFNSFPEVVRSKLEIIRSIIQQESPDAIELLSYQMPSFKLQGRILVYYAAWKEHIGLYAFPSSLIRFKKELSGYHTSKATLQFPLEHEIPKNLLKKIIRFRIQEIEAKKKKNKK